ncbi:hypothetical protein D187_005001 [Cystobacter fuscus DSM 2262]|uniref:Uncharacterized protein n=1 Tax=Cystobacter fuscus (strain ATCC 25194 / DSM 2262 / NBRC 100088 / M29) TaxID=1242864 RepID=S9PLG6_CYSF2|nr:hypothetical protein [Cystobacter fuscus]EPX63871.1 hypothetical protein D187_005001 [Cystobacter fuscus DSM 2262]
MPLPPLPPLDIPAPVRRVAQHAVAAGLTPLVPVPFVDDYALRRVREDMVRSLLAERGLFAPRPTLRVLAGLHPREGSRLQQLAGKAALLSLRLAWRKSYRRLISALWLKDCVDMASLCLHHGYLLHYALERGDLPAHALATPDAARRVQAAIHAACAELDARPINQALRRLWAGSRLVRESLSEALAHFQGAPLRPHLDDSGAETSLAERLAAVLWEKRGYFLTLESLYTKHLNSP